MDKRLFELELTQEASQHAVQITRYNIYKIVALVLQYITCTLCQQNP